MNSVQRSGVRRPPSTAAVLRGSFLVAGAILMLVPVVWAALSSLKDQTELAARPPTVIPHHPSLDNYVEAFTSFNFLVYAKTA